jgi:choline dehydrogenase-like flavoprotein
VIQDVTVSKVLIEGSTAVGVEYLQGNSTEPEILLAAREVILSAGAFGSSKLLMVRCCNLVSHALHQQLGSGLICERVICTMI